MGLRLRFAIWICGPEFEQGGSTIVLTASHFTARVCHPGFMVRGVTGWNFDTDLRAGFYGLGF